MGFRIINITFLSLFLLAAGCGTGGVYIPKSYEVKDPPSRTSAEKKPKKLKKLSSNQFDEPYGEVWRAALESVKWLQWPPAYVDEDQGLIRLKEAYVYRKSGKLFRTYTWPSKDALLTSDINDYIQKIGLHKPKTGQTLFTQENLEIRLKKSKSDITTVVIDYSIRPYTYSGKIGYEIQSNGFIESRILDRMRETLDGSPVAKY